jgi:7,8-dihydropterin-6-yl-methyl-4-(beta-D-ribofuranosyl)aminobenzene 5'-phosphate synthase
MKTLMISIILFSSIIKMTASTPGSDIKLTILYDNYQFDKNFNSSWGFSCLIEGLDQTILFDCGGKDGNLMHNMKTAGIDPSIVDLIVISHNHWDHTGGLPKFLEVRSGIDVWIPASFPEDFSREIESNGSRPVMITEQTQIIPKVWTTGEMGDDIIEQSLVLETEKGLVVLTGCAHPGIESIVEKAAEMRDSEIFLVMGGFHLLLTRTGDLENIATKFKEAGLEYAAPTHCSGKKTMKVFREVFGEKYIQLGAGRILHLNQL